jgi:ABC-type glycerol-3-phosphate transport system substrate-binding protein
MNDRLTKTFSRRQFLVHAGMASAAVALAACAPAPAPGAAPAEEAAAAPPAQPTVAVNDYGSAENPVILWHGLTGADGTTFAQMLEQFAEANPEVGVRSEAYGWDVFFQKFPTSVAAGTPPDMAIFHAAEIPQMSSQGLLQPVDDIFFATGELPKDDFSPVLMDAITYEGNTMSVPFDNHGWVLYVNTRVIEEAGLDPDALPTNGAEFIEWAKQIVVDENGNHPDDSGFDPDRISVFALHYSWPRFSMPSTLMQFGGGTVSADQSTALLSSPESVAAVQYWYDLMYTHHVVPPALPGTPSAYDTFRPGSLALMWDGSWSLNFFRDNPDLEPPVSRAGSLNSLAPDGTQACKMDSHIMAIPTGVDAAGIERASALIKYLSDNGEFWATSGQVPARLTVQQLPSVQEIWSVKAAAEEFNSIGRTEVPHKAFIEIQTAWETAVSAALAQTTPLEESLQTGNDQIQAILDRP